MPKCTTVEELAGDGEGGFKARAGTATLFYICSALDRAVVLALLAEAATGVPLVDEIELPDERAQVDNVLADRYMIEPADPSMSIEEADEHTPLQPTPAGREIPFVAATLQHWLSKCPSGPLDLDDGAGEVLAPLIMGWGSRVTHVLAPGPLTAAEVHEALAVLPLDVVEGQLETMEEVGQVEAMPDGRDGEPRYAVTDWLRAAVAPLAAAARMEHRHPPGDTAPIAAQDVEAAFHLTLPLLELPADLRGTCSLAVELDEGVLGSPSGVTAQIDRGRVVSCQARLDAEADCEVAATAPDWLEMAIEGDTSGARVAGDAQLAGTLLRALHRTLFGPPPPVERSY